MSSTRVFVKDLPDNANEQKIREHFAGCGIITDVRPLYRKDGGFRRIAIVGFKSADDASEAIKKMNRSFIGNSRISVAEYVISHTGAERPRPWSKYSEGSSAYKRRLMLEEKKEQAATALASTPKMSKRKQMLMGLLSDVKDDEQFEEFLENYNTSLNKEILNEESKKRKVEPVVAPVKKRRIRKVKTGPIYKLRIQGLPFKYTEAKLKALFVGCKPRKVRILRDDKKAPKGIAVAWFKTEADLKKALHFNKQRVGKRYLELFPIIRNEEQTEENENTTSGETEKPVEAAPPPKPSETLICKNLWYGCTAEDIRQLMEPFGHVDTVELPTVYSTGQLKGFAVVTFSRVSNAVKAMNELDHTVFQGRLLKVEPHRDGSVTDASSTTQCWNSLFVTADVIASRLAKRFNVSREEVFSTTTPGSSLPVRLAAAEAQIVEQTKKFLTAHGVKLDVFGDSKIKRSKRILLVKNVDIQRLGELKSRMSGFGDIIRWVFPPEGTAGIVEYANAESAAKALASQEGPVKLEPAPTEVFNTDDKSEQSAASQADQNEGYDIYVKRLNFSTTNECLEAHFEHIGPCRAQIAYGHDPESGKLKSLGYGFVTFTKRQHAMEAIKTLQNASLDGHKLELELSLKKQNGENKTLELRLLTNTTDEGQTKICVRNIPFQVSEKEVSELFAVFGELRFVRLPRKPDGGHRGFGFVDFASRKSAKTAFDALSSSTHLFGRRLVLEWAKTDPDDLTTLQRKTARYYEVIPGEKTKSDFIQHLSEAKDNS